MRFRLSTFKKSAMQFIVLWLLLVSHNIFSQDLSDGYYKSDHFENKIPERANVGTLGGFGNTPINYYTGLPEVSLPLFTLESRELKLPVSMNYDATGVRLEEFSGPVGLKWDLSIGGSITRIMNGLPDESIDPSMKGFFLASQLSNNFNSVPNMNEWVTWSGERTLDTEPDEFILSIPGRAFRFVIQNSQVHTIPKQNVQISYTLDGNNEIDSFTVKTEDGIEYYFGGSLSATERLWIQPLTHKIKRIGDFSNGNLVGFHYTYDINQMSFVDHPDIIYNSKWHLKTIVSPTGDVITFNYTALNSITYAARPSVTEGAYVDMGTSYTPIKYNKQFFSMDEPHPAVGTYSPPYLDPHPGGIILNHTVVLEYLRALNSVETSTGARIEVIGDTFTREDLPGAFKVNEIKLFNQAAELIKHYKLNYMHQAAQEANEPLYISEAVMLRNFPYQYLGSTGEHWAWMYKNAYSTNTNYSKYVVEGMKAYNYKRLFLESIDEIETASSSWKKSLRQYAFQYKNRDLLRRRTSPHVSAFGFQAGGTPSSLDFQINIANYAKYSTVSTGSILGNALYGTLDKIYYPTGGFTHFIYKGEEDASSDEPYLVSVKDYKATEQLAAIRRLEYPELKEPIRSGSSLLRFHTYQDWKTSTLGDYVWLKVTSSYPVEQPQRSNGSAIYGVSAVKVFSDENGANGYEYYEFSNFDTSIAQFTGVTTGTAAIDEATLKNTFYPIYSSPQDIDPQGNPVSFIDGQITPFRKHIDKSYLRGHVLKHETVNSSGNVVKSTRNFYSINPEGYSPSSVRGFTGAKVFCGWHSEDQIWKHRRSDVRYYSDWVVLSKTEETTYDDQVPANSVTRQLSYSYDPVNLQLIRTKTEQQGGTTSSIIQETKFVTHTDYTYAGGTPDSYSVAIQNLRARRQLNTPIETKTIIEDQGVTKLVSSLIYKYNKFGINWTKPNEIWGVSQELDPSSYSSSYVNQANGIFTIDTRARKLHTFNSYDLITGNVLTQTTLAGIYSAYTWGGPANSLLTAYSINEGLSDRQVFQFQYKAGVGLSQKSDPNSRNENFEFDEFNRLKLVKDHDNNIQQRLTYHYANVEELVADYDFAINLNNNQANFSATTNVPPGTRYVWDFGDGSINENGGATPSHTYASTGSFSVCLAVVNPELPVKHITKSVVVPTISAIITNTGNSYRLIDICPSPQPLTSNFSASVSGGGPWSYQWEYKPTSNSNWTNVSGGITQNISWGPAGASSGSGYNLRCKLVSTLGYKYSNSVTVEFYCSNPGGGGGGGGGCSEQCTYQQQQDGCYTQTSTCTCVCP